jgi:hypothetical protein
MKRFIVGLAAIVAVSSLIMAAPVAGASKASKAERHTQSVRCMKAVTAHSKLTKAEVGACRSSTFKVSKCPAGSKVVTLQVNAVTYAIQSGHKPLSLGKQPGMGSFSHACGHPKSSTSTTTPALAAPTTVPLPTSTTTTVPRPPVTTTTRAPVVVTTTTRAPVVTTPPTTVPVTAAPANCTPLTNGGNCYEPGEYCRDSDHGVTGRAGDGETITCEDNNGWRWEPT